ncbi:MAG: hypothetical protein BWK79_11525 [Beggiatoa sp. IS2]|nr:MAG: hypothetical protein BWK79_11525 [Beggiatoa sp. IS2]
MVPTTTEKSLPVEETAPEKIPAISPSIKQELAPTTTEKLPPVKKKIAETTPVISSPIQQESASKKEESLPPLRSNSNERKPSNSTENTTSGSSEVTSVRVGIDKIDALINMVGELVITQSMLDQIGDTLDITKAPQLRDGLSQLERNTRELQESVMRIRMLPISYSFNRFPRLVHDLSEQLGKKVDLKLTGEQTELDKTVLEKMNDPLVHLVRNALDHGIEVPAHRTAIGKPD